MRAARTTVQTLRLALLLLGVACGAGCGKAEVENASRQVYDALGQRIQAGPPLRNPPNIIVIVIDALRADAIAPAASQVPPEEQRMPFLSSLAHQGVQFTQASASAPWTLPSMVSLFTGLRPSKHGQNRVQDRWHLPRAVTTLPEVLKSGYGYETAAFVNGAWFQASKESLLQGFTRRETSFSLQGMDGTVGRWNENRDASRPFFLLLHTYDLHDPYGEANHPWPVRAPETGTADRSLLEAGTDPAELFRACYLDLESAMVFHQILGPRLADLLQRYKFRGYAEDPKPELAWELAKAYWDGARWVDDLLASAHAKLASWGMLENTLLVVTSDHGQAFGEHGNLAHTLFLYDEVVKVPLVMTGPAPFEGGRVIDQSVALLDVLPTFLDWVGAAPLSDTDARSLMPLVRGDTANWCRPVVSEERLSRASTGEDTNAIRLAVRTDALKYIATFDLATGQVFEEAYDLVLDPEEHEDFGAGTGTLPEGRPFDACLCAAIEELRELLWLLPADTDPVVTTPYGTERRYASTPRPRPCTSAP